MIYWLGACAVSSIFHLIRRIADDYVKLHISKELLGIVCVDEHVGILLCLGASVIDRLGCATILAFAVLPGVGTVGVEDVAALGVEAGDAVFAVGVLAAIKGAPGQVGSQLRDGDAEDLVVQDVVDAKLSVWHQRFQASVQPFDDFPQEYATLGEWVKECRVRTPEKLLRQQVQDAVRQFWRGEDLVVAQVRDTVEHVRVVGTIHHRRRHLS